MPHTVSMTTAQHRNHETLCCSERLTNLTNTHCSENDKTQEKLFLRTECVCWCVFNTDNSVLLYMTVIQRLLLDWMTNTDSFISFHWLELSLLNVFKEMFEKLFNFLLNFEPSSEINQVKPTHNTTRHEVKVETLEHTTSQLRAKYTSIHRFIYVHGSGMEQGLPSLQPGGCADGNKRGADSPEASPPGPSGGAFTPGALPRTYSDALGPSFILLLRNCLPFKPILHPSFLTDPVPLGSG